MTGNPERTVCINLSRRQFEALAGAVATEEIYAADQRPWTHEQAMAARSLAKAWTKINRAWYRHEEPDPPGT